MGAKSVAGRMNPDVWSLRTLPHTIDVNLVGPSEYRGSIMLVVLEEGRVPTPPMEGHIERAPGWSRLSHAVANRE